MKVRRRRQEGRKDKSRVRDSQCDRRGAKSERWETTGEKGQRRESLLKCRRETKRSRKAKGKIEETESETERDSDRKGGYLSFTSRRGLMVALCASVKRSIIIIACWMLGLSGPADYCCPNGRQAVCARSGVPCDPKTWGMDPAKKHPPA